MEDQIKNILLKGIGSTQVEGFEYEEHKVLSLGRANDNDFVVKGLEDVVSRHHAQIEVKGLQFIIKDLGSTNGLYVNDVKVSEQDLMPGDVIKLGLQGPELSFDVDPRPAELVAKTRLISTAAMTKEVSTMEASDEIIADIDLALSNKRSDDIVGRDTVARMIKNEDSKSNKRTFIFGGIAVLLIALFGFFAFANEKEVPPSTNTIIKEVSTGLESEKIALEYNKSVVQISTAFKLVYTPTGEDIYHMYDTMGGYIYALYVQSPNGQIEPLCTTKKTSAYSKLLAGSGRGTGFIANEDGYIVTNRHIVNTWMDTYSFPSGAFPGKLLVQDNTGDFQYSDYSVNASDLTNFIPINLSYLDQSKIIDKEITGEIFYTDVLFPGSANPISGQVARVSNTHDVALIKINSPEKLKATKMKSVNLNQGKEVLVMGYPGVSSSQLKEEKSKTLFNQTRKYAEVTSPSIFNGIVSKNAGSIKELSKLYSNVGDSYELTVKAGSGASGSPVFNEDGFVVGVFYASKYGGGGEISLALPIKYAEELLSVQ